MEAFDLNKSEIFDEITNILQTAEAQVNDLLKSNDDNNSHEISSPESPYIADNQVNKKSVNFEFKEDVVMESDRTILLNHLEKLRQKIPGIRKLNKFLSLALGEYFSKQNEERAFYELRPEEIRQNTARYESNLENIHKLKQQKENLIEVYEEEKLKRVKEKEAAWDKKNELVNEFLEAIDATAKLLESSSQPISEKRIARLFNRFQRVHNELSKVRCEFIRTQSAKAELIEKDRQLDDLGDGFKAFDFENLKTELQTISSKIDTKNEELERMRIRYARNVQEYEKNQKERQQVEARLEEQKEILNDRNEEKLVMMKKNDQLRRLKESLQNELNDLSQKAQLLTNTNLMIQYDKMEDEFEEKQKELAAIDEENRKIDAHIEKYKNKIKLLEKKKDSKQSEKISELEQQSDANLLQFPKKFH